MGTIPLELPSLTGLTGAHHRSDRCRGFMGLPRVSYLVCVVFASYAFGQFLAGFVKSC
jgi:hypothetical protein